MERDFPETVSAARSGNPAAFGSLFARHLPPLMAFIRIKVGPALAARESVSDLAQSVCREILMDLDEFEYQGEAAFRKWLFLQATRKIVDRSRYHRRARRDQARERRSLQEPSEDEAESLVECYATLCTPSRHAAAREELERIESALQELPESQRDAVTLSRVMGISYREIAKQMGCTESAVRGLVARGLAELSSLLPRDS